MEILDFENSKNKEFFDNKIFNDPLSFVQQTTKWSDIISPIADDVPIFFYQMTDNYFIHGG